MDNLLIDEISQTASSPALLTERRRAGRADYTNKALIALLREPTAEIAGEALAIEESDSLAPARGILLGLLIGVIMWCAIGLTIWPFVG